MKTTKITNPSNDYVKAIAKLNEKKYRDLEQKFIIEGFHLIEMAKDHLEVVFIEDISLLPANINCKVIECSYEVIKKITNTITPQPIAGVCSYFNTACISGQRFLLLDNVSDPANIGSLLRSSLAFNIDCIILSNDCCSIYNPKVIRTTQGALFEIPFIYLDLAEAIKIIKNKNITVYGTKVDNGIILNSVEPMNSFAVVLGNEGNGIRSNILELCDQNLYIKTTNKIDSLSVSVAGAIILNHLAKEVI